MKKNFLSTAINFLLIFLAVNFVINTFFKPQNDVPNQITLTTKADFGLGDIVNVEIKNTTQQTVTIKDECPGEPLEVLFSNNGTWTPKAKQAEIACTEAKDIVVKPGEKQAINYHSWNHALFGELGKYKLQAKVIVTAPAAPAGTTPEIKNIESNEFEMKPQGIFGYLWTTVFYQPLYNTLIFLLSIVPGHNLGLAIILLTIIIRTILLIPSQNALKSQRKLQEVQPKLNKIKEKYKDNQEMIAKETMAIWKEHKVNPFGSCLPLVIQFPVLIALFNVVQNGLNPDNSYLLYGTLQNFSFASIDTNFLNLLNLTQVNYFVLPLIVGVMQFFQMKLAIVKNEKAKDKGPAGGTAQPKSEMETANNLMLYVMPAMIAFFTASVPAGVGVYWATSTLYGIAQQLVVNSEAEKGSSKVKVLN